MANATFCPDASSRSDLETAIHNAKSIPSMVANISEIQSELTTTIGPDLEAVKEEVTDARGDFASLNARITALEARVAALEPSSGGDSNA